MAKFIESYESEKDLTIFTVVGEITFDEVWDQTCTFFSGRPSKLVLWDFMSGTAKNVSSQELAEIAEKGGTISAIAKGGKGAILAPKDIDFGIGRIFQAFSQMKNFPLEVQIFRDMNTAKKWLVFGQ